MSFLALVGLVCFRLLGWWWTDRAAALVVAAVAGVEAYRIFQEERRPGRSGAPRVERR